MTIKGRVVNGQIVLEPGSVIPDGTDVSVHFRDPLPLTGRPATVGERLLALAGTIPDLPTDAAAQHDHYARGVPKR